MIQFKKYAFRITVLSFLLLISFAWKKEAEQTYASADAEVLKNLPMVNALLVMQHGKLIHEKYFHNFKPDSNTYIFSITKSITGTLIGILRDEGKIVSFEQPVMDFLPDYFGGNENPYQKDLKLKHLLSQTSGFDWDERRLDLLQAHIYNLSADIQKKPAYPPGEHFNYDDANTELLSHIITKLTGKAEVDYAYEKLFQPLGIPKPAWLKDNKGCNIGGYGLLTTPGNVLKLGQLYLNKGILGGRQLIPQAYINEATVVHSGGAFPGNTSYGYLWWIDKKGSTDYYYGLGYGGQFLFVVPSLDMVCVIISDSRLGIEKLNQPKYLFTDFILP